MSYNAYIKSIVDRAEDQFLRSYKPPTKSRNFQDKYFYRLVSLLGKEIESIPRSMMHEISQNSLKEIRNLAKGMDIDELNDTFVGLVSAQRPGLSTAINLGTLIKAMDDPSLMRDLNIDLLHYNVFVGAGNKRWIENIAEEMAEAARRAVREGMIGTAFQ